MKALVGQLSPRYLALTARAAARTGPSRSPSLRHGQAPRRWRCHVLRGRRAGPGRRSGSSSSSFKFD